MTVEIAQLAAKCAQARLAEARECLIDAIVVESGRDPKAQLFVSFREILRVLRGAPSVSFEAAAASSPRPVDPRF